MRTISGAVVSVVARGRAAGLANPAAGGAVVTVAAEAARPEAKACIRMLWPEACMPLTAAIVAVLGAGGAVAAGGEGLNVRAGAGAVAIAGAAADAGAGAGVSAGAGAGTGVFEGAFERVVPLPRSVG